MNAELNARFARLAEKVAESGDKVAFAELFDYFAPRLKAYLMRLGMAAGEAEELAQEVMLVLWRKAALFDPAKSSLSTWIFRVARNRRIDALRRDRSGNLDENDPMLWPEPADAPDEAVDAERRDARIRLAMEALPAEQLELVRMAFFFGLSHSQIAERTSLPLGTVKSRIRLAFARLKTALDDDPRVDTKED